MVPVWASERAALEHDAAEVLLELCSSDPALSSHPRALALIERFAAASSASERGPGGAGAPPGATIDQYELLDLIGTGVSGTARLARHRATGDVVVIKTMPKARAAGAGRRLSAVLAERQIMAEVAARATPGLLGLREAFQDRDNLYISMPFQPGGDLFQLLEARPELGADEQAARIYVAELVAALNRLHKLGWVHRDVKPDNVLIGSAGHLVLGDFGSAARSGEPLTGSAAAGTADYIAPEAITENSTLRSTATVTPGLDWWAVGVVAYEIMLGRMPFTDEAGREAQTLARIVGFEQSLEIPRSDDGVPGPGTVSSDAASLLRGLLSKPDSRFGYDEIVAHPFFAGVDWATLGSVESPVFVPELESETDLRYFDLAAVSANHAAEAAGDQASSLLRFRAKHGVAIAQLPFVGWSCSVMPARPGPLLAHAGTQTQGDGLGGRTTTEQPATTQRAAAPERQQSPTSLSQTQGDRLGGSTPAEQPATPQRAAAPERQQSPTSLSGTVSAPAAPRVRVGAKRLKPPPPLVLQTRRPASLSQTQGDRLGGSTPAEQPATPQRAAAPERQQSPTSLSGTVSAPAAPRVRVGAKRLKPPPPLVLQTRRPAVPSTAPAAVTRTLSALGLDQMPSWKARLLEKRRQKRVDAASLAQTKVPEVKYAYLPQWRRELLTRQDANLAESAEHAANVSISTVASTSG